MTEHDFTAAERAAIEQAATDHLGNHFVQSDAEEIAYDIANDIRKPIVTAAYAETAEAVCAELLHRYEVGADSLNGITVQQILANLRLQHRVWADAAFGVLRSTEKGSTDV